MRAPQGLCLLLVSGLVGGCVSAPQADVNSVDPQERTLGIAQIARDRDQSSIPDLVSRLDSDDPAERMMAIRTLERLTGETLGYDYADPRPQRDEAVARWVAWVDQREGGAASEVAGAERPARDADTEGGPPS